MLKAKKLLEHFFTTTIFALTNKKWVKDWVMV